MLSGIIIPEATHINPGATFAQLIGRLVGMFQRFPTDFQKEALLRINGRGFQRRNVKEVRIKLVNIL